jgi:hypothetical protein
VSLLNLWSYSKHPIEELIIINNMQKYDITFDRRIPVLSWNHLLLVHIVVIEVVVVEGTEVGITPLIIPIVVASISSHASPVLIINHPLLLIHVWEGLLL